MNLSLLLVEDDLRGIVMAALHPSFVRITPFYPPIQITLLTHPTTRLTQSLSSPAQPRPHPTHSSRPTTFDQMHFVSHVEDCSMVHVYCHLQWEMPVRRFGHACCIVIFNIWWPAFGLFFLVSLTNIFIYRPI